MKIGIDISQAAYEGTGVGRYVRRLTEAVVTAAPQHSFLLFGGSVGRRERLQEFADSLAAAHRNVTSIILPLSPRLLDLLWNRLHIVPIEWLTGPLDVFWSSDWTQPPLSRARGITTIHDLSVYHYPKQFDRLIVSVQKRRLKRAVRECSMFLCDSEATRKDAVSMLHIPEERAVTVYPGGGQAV